MGVIADERLSLVGVDDEGRDELSKNIIPGYRLYVPRIRTCRTSEYTE